jgi:hypothetical protein
MAQNDLEEHSPSAILDVLRQIQGIRREVEHRSRIDLLRWVVHHISVGNDIQS